VNPVDSAVPAPPALTARVWVVLFRNEWFKTRKRRAFWITLAFFSFITFMQYADRFFAARNDPERSFTLPEIWPQVFEGESVITIIFASIALILMSSSEFSWRTARQNVIDGLSKTQWYWGKTLLIPMLGVAFVSLHVGIPAVLGILGTDSSSASGPMFPVSVLAATGGTFLAYTAVAALAIFLSLAIRSSGPAMAAWFFWIGFGEQLGAGLLGRAVPSLRPILGYLPFTNAQAGMNFRDYDSAAFEQAVAAATAAERAPPELADLSTIMLVNIGWVALFLVVGYVWFRRRDL
jgi:ABC-type transport system involved in multi-copper enzyme maturation permease subunit